MQPDPFHRPPAREPVFNLPPVIIVIAGALLLIHLLVSNLDQRSAVEVVFTWGFVPGAWTVWRDPGAADAILREILASGDVRARVSAQFALIEAPSSAWSVLTYALLHGSWSHVLLNCVWLAAFGTPIARRLGTARFLALCLATATGGPLAHWLFHSGDFTPMVGASAVVSGMMGAAAWFVFARSASGALVDPHAHLRPRETLQQMLRNRRTLIFFGIWFALNFLFGVGAAPLGISDGGVAWEAHIGGFLVGLALFPRLDPLPPPAPPPVYLREDA
ncbi:MAG: rhomboid family intramembrane serine protease [Salinarimonadaceae bacterium]|nr:MAG: rhomboid family intramembrane serine protease [Salinarimonadaceae bacterium]